VRVSDSLLEELTEATEGPAPRSETQRAEAEGDAIKVMNEITDASGRTMRLGYSAKYDGKPYPYPGSPWDTIALTQVDAYTSSAAFVRGGKVVQTDRLVRKKGLALEMATQQSTAAHASDDFIRTDSRMGDRFQGEANRP